MIIFIIFATSNLLIRLKRTLTKLSSDDKGVKSALSASVVLYSPGPTPSA